MNIFETFKKRWENENLDVYPPKDEESIIECFEQLGLFPSTDLLELYKTMDGKGCMDLEMFELWPLDRIIEENSSEKEREKAKRFGILFADYSLWCWAFRVNSKGQVLIDNYDGNEPEIKANSVKEFFELMLKDPDEAIY